MNNHPIGIMNCLDNSQPVTTVGFPFLGIMFYMVLENFLDPAELQEDELIS
jgi:hypothetical protein